MTKYTDKMYKASHFVTVSLTVDDILVTLKVFLPYAFRWHLI